MSTLEANQWMHIRDTLAKHFGLYLDESRANQGFTKVRERCATLGITLHAYYELIKTRHGQHELHWLAEQLANHETLFFRNPAHFRALEQLIFPKIHQDRPLNQALRCWSAGCATGEEAYSMAMVAAHLWGTPLARPVQIWGTDLSRIALAKARLGEYRGRTLTNIQPQYQRWLKLKDSGMYGINTYVQSLVQFEQHNLLDALPAWATNLDVVFCQNVTIYFQLETCRQLIERIYKAMNIGGYLLLGFSESLWGIFDGFETVEVQGAFVYRKPEQPLPPAKRLGSKPLVALVQPNTARQIARPSVERPALVVKPNAEQIIEQARTWRSVGQQRQALETLRQLAPEQRTPAVVAFAAQLHADLGQREQAAAEARRALELDVMQESAYVTLGMLELQHGAWSEAARYLEKALYLMPNSPIVSFHLAESYRHLGQTDAARREYSNTARKLNNVPPTTIYEGVTAGWIQTACERWIASLVNSKQ